MSAEPTHEIEGKYFAHAHAMSIATSLLKHAVFCEEAGKNSTAQFPLLEEHRLGQQIPPVQTRIACLSYLAFSLEGYLELIGQEEFEEASVNFMKAPWWKRLFQHPKAYGVTQKKWYYLKTVKKLRKVVKHYRLNKCLGAEVFQTVGKLFEFRNSQAHPKLLKVNAKCSGKDVHRIFDSLTVYEHLDPQDAERVYKLVRDIVALIEEARPRGDRAIWLTISQMTSSTEN